MDIPRVFDSMERAASFITEPMSFRIAASGRLCRPQGVSRVPGHLAVETVLGFTWEILELNGKWEPWEVDTRNLLATTPDGVVIDKWRKIGCAGTAVQLVVSTGGESFSADKGQDMKPNVNLDNIGTPDSHYSDDDGYSSCAK